MNCTTMVGLAGSAPPYVDTVIAGGLVGDVRYEGGDSGVKVNWREGCDGYTLACESA